MIELKKQRAQGTERPVAGGANLPALANLYEVHAKANDEYFASLHAFTLKKGKSSRKRNVGAYFQGRDAANGISLNQQVNGSGTGLLK